MSASGYVIGIDTGGTYTDAAIFDLSNRTIIASAKALTTKGDLSRGIASAMQAALAQCAPALALDRVRRVCLSTTLATNAMVEGHGGLVDTFLIGFTDGMELRSGITEALADVRVVTIAGGHRHDGSERAPLDLAALDVALAERTADAYAVSAHYAVRNADHERRAGAHIFERTGKPVTLSSDLSDALDGPARARTAACNARIIPLLVKLERAVHVAMQEIGIEARVMIVRGDGSIATAEVVLQRPIETILSGPAASVAGARFLTELDDFIICDIGGTTSDVAKVRDGWPALKRDGSHVGGLRTLVRSIDMRTEGLGGDSALAFDRHNAVQLDTRRAVPLSLVVARWPQIEQELQQALTLPVITDRAIAYLLPQALGDAADQAHFDPLECELLQQLNTDKPTAYRDLALGARTRASITKLVRQGALAWSGFTPSDAAHILGLQSQWSRAGAMLGAELLLRASGLLSGLDVESEIEAFAQKVYQALCTDSTRLLIESLGDIPPAEGRNALIETIAAGGNTYADLAVSLRANVPIVAVGGPAPVFYPEVGRRLGVEVVIPPRSEVANAIGAAVGVIRARAVITISRADDGHYVIHHGSPPERHTGGDAAMARACELVKEQALQLSAEMGAGDRLGDIELDIQRIDIPHMTDEGRLVSAIISAQVVGAART